MARRSPIPSFTTTLFLSSKIPGSLFLTGRIFFRERSSPVAPHPSLMFIIARFSNYCIGSSMFFSAWTPRGIIFSTSFFILPTAFSFIGWSMSSCRARRGSAFAVAVLFLLHPVQSEAVACISGISNLLFAFLVLASLCFYLRNSIISHVLSLLAFALALLAKEQAVVLPILIVLLEIIYPPSVTRPISPPGVQGLVGTLSS